MSSTASNVDDDIRAAFAGQTPAPVSAAVDDDIAAAFKDSGTQAGNPKRVGWAEENLAGPGEVIGSTIANIPHAAAHGAVDLYRRLTGGDTEAPEPAAVRALQVPTGAGGKQLLSDIGDMLPKRNNLPNQPDDTAIPEFSDTTKSVLGHAASVGQDVGSIVAPAAMMKGALTKAPLPPTAEEIINRSSSSQSMGAAAASPNIKAISPQLQKAVVDASRKTGGAVNPDVLRAHIEAEEHGVQLMRGQATRDPEQFTAEQNSTHPAVVSRLNAQNGQMVDAIDTVRRDASPSTVGNDYIENGRSAVDALKQYDEPIQADIRAKYKALTDANGGSVPIDTGQFLQNVNSALKKGFLTKTAGASPEVSEILDSVRSGEPMDFEAYENARTRLASAQRAGGSAGEAARIVRGELEQMPLSFAASQLKGLADAARSAAKSRFTALEADPAYQAAVDDVSAGNKKGSPTPLADTFLDKYALSKSAPKSQVDLMMQKIKATDPDAAGAVASHTLSAIRKAAVNPNGNVLPNGYNGALQKLGPKLDSLIEPETRDSLESLGRTITNAKVEPAGGKVNYSRSGVVARDAIQSAVEGIANAKTGGLYSVAKKMLPKDNAFAKEALTPGAGLDQLKTKP